jgi:hypothetical protein
MPYREDLRDGTNHVIFSEVTNVYYDRDLQGTIYTRIVSKSEENR